MLPSLSETPYLTPLKTLFPLPPTPPHILSLHVSLTSLPAFCCALKTGLVSCYLVDDPFLLKYSSRE